MYIGNIRICYNIAPLLYWIQSSVNYNIIRQKINKYTSIKDIKVDVYLPRFSVFSSTKPGTNSKVKMNDFTNYDSLKIVVTHKSFTDI